SGTIALAKGCTYTLDGIDNTTDGPSGLPVIRGSVTILGSGATLARAPSAPPFRFFTVDAAGALNLQRLTLRGGAIPWGQTLGGHTTSVFGGGAVGTAHANGQIPACPPPTPGACELRAGASTLLTSDTLVDNTAETDGGGVSNAGTTSIMSSTITRNVTVS